MRPKIDDTWFGSITVEGQHYEHDIVVKTFNIRGESGTCYKADKWHHALEYAKD